MASDDSAVTSAYLEHLTDEDLALLCRSDRAWGATGDNRALVRRRRGGIEGLLSSRDVFEALFIADRGSGPIMLVSPFLAFAIAVQQAKVELSSASYVPEWVGVGRRTPVFDVPRLVDFVSAPWRCFFLTELLASYSRVASGSVVVRTRRGLRRQRFSELDPVRLAGLLDLVPDTERPGVFRRLGDLALFLTGVFPDYVGRRGLSEVDQARLLRSVRPSGRSEVARDGPVPASRQWRRQCRRPARPARAAVVYGRVPPAAWSGPGERRRDQRDAGAVRRRSAHPQRDRGPVPVRPPGPLVRPPRLISVLGGARQ